MPRMPLPLHPSLPLLFVLAVGVACEKERTPASITSSGGGREGTRRAAEPTEEEKLAYTTRAYAKVKDEIARFERLVATNPTDALSLAQLGRNLMAGGLERRGTEALEKSLELNPAMAEAAVLLARVYLRRDDLASAQRVVDRAKEGKASDPGLRVVEAQVVLHRDPTATTAARALIDSALAIDPRHVEANYESGVLAQRTGDTVTAERCLRVVIERDPSHLGAHYNLARLLRKLGRTAEADEVSRNHRRLGILETLGQQLEPESVNSYLGVAEVLQNGGDAEGALAELAAAIERHPDAALPRVRRALLLIQVQRVDEGRQVFDVAVRKLPDDPIVLNQYAWYLATTAVNADDKRRALKLAERAVVASRRQDPNHLDTLAEARLANGDVAGADAALAEAIALRPGDPQLTRRRVELTKRAEKP